MTPPESEAMPEPVQPPPAVPKWLIAEARFNELAKSGDQAQAAARYGIELFQAKDALRAAEALRWAVLRDPAQALYWANLGAVLMNLDQGAEAVAMFDRSLAIDPEQAQIWMNLANSLTRMGEEERAEQALLQAAKHGETAVEALMGLGAIRMNQFRYKDAADFFRQAIAAGGKGAVLQSRLGAACFQIGEIGEARGAYGKAASLAPAEAGYLSNFEFLKMLEGVMEGRAEVAVARYAKPLEDDETLISALRRALLFLTSFDNREATRALVEEWLGYYPEDIEPRYIKAILDGRKFEKAPKAYIAAHFDRLAPHYDDRFIESLNYRVPSEMDSILVRNLGTEWKGDILDAGCGSGFYGPSLNERASALTGVDLSPRMLDRARARAVYDELVASDIAEFLWAKPRAFDLIVAADSLIYTGALEPVFEAAANALKRGGLMIFNLESQDEGYAIALNGRFRHAEGYVEKAAGSPFQMVESTALTLRHEAGSPVPGRIFLLRRL